MYENRTSHGSIFTEQAVEEHHNSEHILRFFNLLVNNLHKQQSLTTDVRAQSGKGGW